MSGKELRKYPRIEANAYVDYTGDEVLLFHQIENISLGGLSIKCPRVERVGTTVELVVNMPEEDLQIDCLGEVVWAKENEEGSMGVKFINLQSDQREKLKAFLSKIDPFYV